MLCVQNWPNIIGTTSKKSYLILEKKIYFNISCVQVQFQEIKNLEKNIIINLQSYNNLFLQKHLGCPKLGENKTA